jgi:hypothetical protein
MPKIKTKNDLTGLNISNINTIKTVIKQANFIQAIKINHQDKRAIKQNKVYLKGSK